MTQKIIKNTLVEKSMSDALRHYCDQVSILKKGYAQEKYRIDQMCASFLGSKLVREITSVDIASYRDLRLSVVNPRNNQTLSTSTVRLEMSLLSNFFDICRIEWGFCAENPVIDVRKPKSAQGRDRRLSAREERLILRYAHEHVNADFYVIVVLALETAMRQGEILNLFWENVNFKTKVAHLPETKNGTKRDVPLSIKARDALFSLGVKNRGRVFSYTANGLKSTWRFMLKKLKIENLHFHDLRHEAISRFFELGTLDVMEVATISGHKSLAMLKRYTHLKAERLVTKLEGHKSKRAQAVINQLMPYPALVERLEDRFCVRLLDFEGVLGIGLSHESAVCVAQDALLRKILTMMRKSEVIPLPDQYLENVNEAHIVMIDPLAERVNT